MSVTTDVTTDTDTTSRQRVAFLVAPEGIERVELEEPWQALADAGHEPVLISTTSGEAQTFDHLDRAGSQQIDRTVADTTPEEYAALVLPGGVANPDALRTDADAVSFVRAFMESAKPVAAICHAPWTLAEAGALQGRKLTSWPSLQTDLRNAGASWVDEQVVTDHGLVTSRKPDDIPAFCRKMIEEFCEGRHAGHRHAAE